MIWRGSRTSGYFFVVWSQGRAQDLLYFIVSFFVSSLGTYNKGDCVDVMFVSQPSFTMHFDTNNTCYYWIMSIADINRALYEE